MAYLEVEDSRRIYYEHHAGPGRPVVLVHGWGVTGRCWDTVLPALLANGNEVVVIDQRCCGRSDKDFADVSIDALGSDVVRVVEALGLRKPVLNGWSLGGAVVVDAAAKLGANLGGLVLTGGATPRYTSCEDWPYGGSPADLEATLAAIGGNRAEVLKGVAGAVCHTDVGQATVDWMWLMFLEAGPRADESLRDLGRVDQRETITTLDVPVLLLAGRHDTFVPFDAIKTSAGMFPKARLVAFEETGHAPFLEEGEKYRSELLAFLNGLDG